MQQYRIIERDGQRDILGEGLLWSARDNAVYWTDILAPALNRLSLADGRVGRWAMPEYVGWVIERRDKPGFIAGFKTGFAELDLEPLRLRPIVSPEPALPGNRLNDAKADSKGRIWAGTMSMPRKNRWAISIASIPAARSPKMDSGYIVCNGPALKPR